MSPEPKLPGGNYFCHAATHSHFHTLEITLKLSWHVSSAKGSDRVLRDPKQMAADELPGDEVVEM